MPNEMIVELMWGSGCDFAALRPQRLEAVFCACVCACAWSGHMHVGEDIADVPARVRARCNPTHTMINIRNVGEFSHTWKPVSVFKRKIHHGSFEEWVTGRWFLPTILSSGMKHWWYFLLPGISPDQMDSLWGKQYFLSLLSVGRVRKQKQERGSDLPKAQEKSELYQAF